MNDTRNIATGKPKIGGAVYSAPRGTALPTNATDTLSEDYVCLGYVSDDGVTNSTKRDSDSIKAWGGDTVASPQKEFTDEFKLTFIESLNSDVLKTVYGKENVSGKLDTGIEIKVNSKELDNSVYVIDTVMGDAVKRFVIADAKVTEVGDVTYKDNELVAYETTLTAYPSTALNGDTHREYMVSEG